jgi:hypothetical protein
VAFLPLANLLSESEMMEWANTTIACTEDYMAGAFVDQPSPKPWKSPPSWASTDQYLVVQVGVWLRTIATRTGGVVDPSSRFPSRTTASATSPEASASGCIDVFPSPSRHTQSPYWCPLQAEPRRLNAQEAKRSEEGAFLRLKCNTPTPRSESKSDFNCPEKA